MLKIYEIEEEIQALDGLIDSWAVNHEGDISDFPLNDELERLEGERNEKLLNLAVWHKDLKAQADAFSQEIKRLQTRHRALSSKADSIKGFIDYSLQAGEKLSDIRAVLSYRKSSQVVIDVLPEDLPQKFIKTSISPDKAAIKEYIKTGDCHFAHMQENQSLQIK
ncbi:siphovirus Gp157 family protein [Candidatus Pacearchaeota archaeon]|nr:siphovirus Gp157 family protein [Candidatus Pacearchaeota archaeon]